MLKKIKQTLYFYFAWYFKFWANFRLKRWHPRIILITGSSGKTTLLNLIESQLGDKAHYSHEANSSFGIPFDILGLRRHTLLPQEWLKLFFLAPIKAFFPPFKEKIYVVEADCDRPHEGKFLSVWLKPEVTLWLSLSKTHAMNFSGIEAIAREFSYFTQNTSRLVIVNADNPHITAHLPCIPIQKVSIKNLHTYRLSPTGTQFNQYKFKYLLPRVHWYALSMTLELLKYLKIKPDLSFRSFHLPPGRSSIFKGIKNTTLIDSAYNSNYESLAAVLDLFQQFPGQKKWAVIGDMLELGKEEASEHQKLIPLIKKLQLEKLILYGPRIKQHLAAAFPKTPAFLYPREVLEYLLANLQGGETILFKGARFLEGVIENLLADKNNVKYLSRREKVWEIRRKQWDLKK